MAHNVSMYKIYQCAYSSSERKPQQGPQGVHFTTHFSPVLGALVQGTVLHHVARCATVLVLNTDIPFYFYLVSGCFAWQSSIYSEAKLGSLAPHRDISCPTKKSLAC